MRLHGHSTVHMGLLFAFLRVCAVVCAAVTSLTLALTVHPVEEVT